MKLNKRSQKQNLCDGTDVRRSGFSFHFSLNQFFPPKLYFLQKTLKIDLDEK